MAETVPTSGQLRDANVTEIQRTGYSFCGCPVVGSRHDFRPSSEKGAGGGTPCGAGRAGGDAGGAAGGARSRSDVSRARQLDRDDGEAGDRHVAPPAGRADADRAAPRAQGARSPLVEEPAGALPVALTRRPAGPAGVTSGRHFRAALARSATSRSARTPDPLPYPGPLRGRGQTVGRARAGSVHRVAAARPATVSARTTAPTAVAWVDPFVDRCRQSPESSHFRSV